MTTEKEVTAAVTNVWYADMPAEERDPVFGDDIILATPKTDAFFTETGAGYPERKSMTCIGVDLSAKPLDYLYRNANEFARALYACASYSSDMEIARREMETYVLTGSTASCLNLPQIELEPVVIPNSRLLVLAKRRESAYLLELADSIESGSSVHPNDMRYQENEHLFYLVVDFSREVSVEAMDEIMEDFKDHALRVRWI